MAKKGLGRGLSALIPDKKKEITNTNKTGFSIKDEAIETKEDNILEIDISKIKANPFQPRIEFLEDELEELANSIKEKGILQPVVVRKKGDFYELVVGERRLKAAKKAGLKKIPAIIKSYSDKESLEVAIIENIQRSNLSPIEEAKAFKRLMSEFNLTQQEVSEKVGKSRVFVANTVRLLNLPEDIQQLVTKGVISMGHARALLSLDSEKKQMELANRIVFQGLSVRETENIVSNMSSKIKKSQKIKKKKSNTTDSPYLNAMAEKLQEILGTKVVISENSSKQIGKIEIHFYSHDDLDRILDIIT